MHKTRQPKPEGTPVRAARKLTVHRETLRLLGDERLEGVAGGLATKTCPVITVDCTDRCSLFIC